MLRSLPVRYLAFFISLIVPPTVLAQTGDSPVAVPVVVAPVTVEPVSTGQRVVGSVVPLRTSVIGSAVDGRVVEMYVKRGDAVAANQAIAQLRTETLTINLAAARAELRLYEQQLAEFANGSRAEDIEEARAQLGAARATMENAAQRLERGKALPVSRISASELGDLREQAESTRQLFLASQANFERVEQGARPEQIAQAEARVDLQSQQVRLIEDRITKHTIVAPFDGFVSDDFTEVGAWIKQGDPVARVIELQGVEVRAHVPAESVMRLRRGDVVNLQFPELPKEVIRGKIERIVPFADEQTRTFPIYVHVFNNLVDGVPRLMAGMLVRVDIPSHGRQMMPTLPKDALVLNGQDRFVFVVRPGAENERIGTAERIPVALGDALGTNIQVKGDVKPGDLVVVLGNERLKDKALVRIVRTLDVSAPPSETESQ